MSFESCEMFAESGFLEKRLYEFAVPILSFENQRNVIVRYKIEQFTTTIFYGNL